MIQTLVLRSSEYTGFTTVSGSLAWRGWMVSQTSGSSFDRKVVSLIIKLVYEQKIDWFCLSWSSDGKKRWVCVLWYLKKITALWHHDGAHTAVFFILRRRGWNLKDLLKCQADGLHGPRPNIWWRIKTQLWEENLLPHRGKVSSSPLRCRCSSKSSRVTHVCQSRERNKEVSAVTASDGNNRTEGSLAEIVFSWWFGDIKGIIQIKKSPKRQGFQ